MKPYHSFSAKPYAVVIGLDCMAGLQAVRILVERKVPVVACANKLDHYNCRTRLCEKIYGVDTTSDALIDLLIEIGPMFEQKPVLVPCEDWNVKNISRHREVLQTYYRFILPDADMIDMVFNKMHFYQYATEHNFPIPQTFVVSNHAELERASAQLTYPCIMKPTGRNLLWEEHTKFKVYKARNAEELFKYYELFHNFAAILLLQEWVVGPDKNIRSCYVYFDKHSQPRISVTARKVRQWPPETGMSCLGEEYPCEDVRQIALRLFGSLGLQGLGHLEMKMDERTGKYYIIEAHVIRPTGQSPVSEAAGVDLLYSMYCDALDWPLPSNLTQHYRGVRWIHFRRDLQASFYYWRRGELSFGDWLASLWGKKVDAVFAWNDMGPFLADLWRGVKLYLHPDPNRQ